MHQEEVSVEVDPPVGFKKFLRFAFDKENTHFFVWNRGKGYCHLNKHDFADYLEEFD
jgi:hypothetical protein